MPMPGRGQVGDGDDTSVRSNGDASVPNERRDEIACSLFQDVAVSLGLCLACTAFLFEEFKDRRTCQNDGGGLLSVCHDLAFLVLE